MNVKLGRRPRAFRPYVPHLSCYLAQAVQPPIPVAADYTKGMPKQLGVLLNDTLGDCTCAAYYHALDVWSANVRNNLDTSYDDSDVLQLYERACGYNPSDPRTDQGGVEQDVLSYLCRTGAKVNKGAHRLVAFAEVDVRNIEDVKRCIYDCGVAYIGFNVPAFVMDLTAPDSVWDVQSGNSGIEGGHAVVLAGYDANGVRVISWGNYYTMTWEFFSKYTDEAYALADSEWIASTGRTPAGMTMQQLKDAMLALK